MSETYVFGASGYIGKHMAAEVGSGQFSFVTRNLMQGINNAGWIEADLLKPESLANLLTPNSRVINLAYSVTATPAENIAMAENLIRACIQAKVTKLVHCSTAVVVGTNESFIIDENAECLPSTEYERAKLEIEKIFMGAANAELTICILRPTAVLGTGGLNIKKMLSEIRQENILLNFIRSSVQGRRRLNLIPVRDVVRALLHLCKQPGVPSGIYICSADDDPDNRYDRVEEIIRAALKQERRISKLSLPGYVLNIVLKVGRKGSAQIANRYYSSEKLSSTGFQRTEAISVAVREFVLTEVRRNTSQSVDSGFA